MIDDDRTDDEEHKDEEIVQVIPAKTRKGQRGKKNTKCGMISMMII